MQKREFCKKLSTHNSLNFRPKPSSQLLAKLDLKQVESPSDDELLVISRNFPWLQVGPEKPVKQETQESVIKGEVADRDWPSEQPPMPQSPVHHSDVAMTNVDELFNGIWDLLPTFYEKVREVASTMTAEEKQPYVTRIEVGFSSSYHRLNGKLQNITRMVRLNAKDALATNKRQRQCH